MRRGKVSPQLAVPEHIPRPSCVGSNRPQELSAVRQVHNAEGISGMRAACKLAACALDFAGTLVKVKIILLYRLLKLFFISQSFAYCTLYNLVIISMSSQPSVTTNEIDRAVHNMIVEAGAYPSALGYGGFPKSICTSVNECVCHGIPDSTQLQVL